jgi:chemotaxis protein methyltransferase WspC
MLIYFNIENKYKVLEKIHGLMCPDGLLFLGHAETGRIDYKLFETMRHPGAFAYRWRDPFITEKTEKPATKVKTPPVVSATAFKKNKPFSSNTSSYKERPPENLATENFSGVECIQENVVEIGELQHIENIADKGELEKAVVSCNDYILANPYSAKGYCLLGVIQLANNDGAAIESFRKALYLDPDHYQSLVHLSILSEEDGNQKAAENYRVRAERVSGSRAVN